MSRRDEKKSEVGLPRVPNIGVARAIWFGMAVGGYLYVRLAWVGQLRADPAWVGNPFPPLHFDVLAGGLALASALIYHRMVLPRLRALRNFEGPLLHSLVLLGMCSVCWAFDLSVAMIGATASALTDSRWVLLPFEAVAIALFVWMRPRGGRS